MRRRHHIVRSNQGQLIGRTIVAWNPVFYAIDGFRYGFTGSSEGAPLLGALLLLAIDAALFVAIYRLFASGYKLKP